MSTDSPITTNADANSSPYYLTLIMNNPPSPTIIQNLTTNLQSIDSTIHEISRDGATVRWELGQSDRRRVLDFVKGLWNDEALGLESYRIADH